MQEDGERKPTLQPLDTEAYLPDENEQVAVFEKRGFPREIRDVETALEVVERLSLLEAIAMVRTENRGLRRTAANFYLLFVGYVYHGGVIRMLDIPIEELRHIAPPGNDDRVTVMSHFIKAPEDATEVPPPIFTYRKQVWRTVDGMTRTSTLVKVGAESVLAYYLPEDFMMKHRIDSSTLQLPDDIKRRIPKPRDRMGEARTLLEKKSQKPRILRWIKSQLLGRG